MVMGCEEIGVSWKKKKKSRQDAMQEARHAQRGGLKLAEGEVEWGGEERWKEKQEEGPWLLGLLELEADPALSTAGCSTHRGALRLISFCQSQFFLFVPRLCWNLSWKMAPLFKSNINFFAVFIVFPLLQVVNSLKSRVLPSDLIFSAFPFFAVCLYFFHLPLTSSLLNSLQAPA